MRSIVAGLSGILVFAVLQWIAKRFFAATLEAHGAGRDIISAIVIGGSLATFILVYFAYSPRKARRRKRGQF